MENLIKFKNNLRRYFRKIDKLKILIISVISLTYLIIVVFDVVPVEKRFSLRMIIILLGCGIYFVYLKKKNKE